MNILFIYPNIVESPKDISTGLGVLVTIAREKGHKIHLIDSSFGISDEEVLRKAKAFKPDLVAITTATNDFQYAVHIVKLIKKIMPGVKVIAGGFHPTIAPDETINTGLFDIVCVGEGEKAFIELIDNLKKGKPIDKIKNLWIKKSDGKILKNPPRPLEQNLDSLPFPDREIFNYEKYLEWNRGTFSLISTRGCPYRCTYCINHFLNKLYSKKGKYVRFRSVDNLIQEIKEAIKKYGSHIKNIEFYDDTFTLDEKRIKEFCEIYPKEIGLPFNINARVNAIKPGMFERLKKAGCVRVSIGIESGDSYIRNKILKRDMTDEQIIKTFKAAKKAGLKTYSFNMVGIPFETKESIKKTIELNRKCKPDYVGVSIFTAFKGTEIYDICEKNNWITKKYAKSYFRDSNINHPNFTLNKLRKIRNSFGFNVFISYKPLRAVIDIIDKNLSQINLYVLLRSQLIEKLNILKLIDFIK